MGKYRSNLQAMRKRAGFKSAREFAEHANINVKTYTNHEQGDTSMSLIQAWEYADLFHCTLDELAGRDWPSNSMSLSSRERRLIKLYRDSDERGQVSIDAVAIAQQGWVFHPSMGEIRIIRSNQAR